MAKKLIMFFLFAIMTFILFIVSVMSMDAPSASVSNFYITFGVGFIILALIFYAINWLISEGRAKGLKQKIVLSFGLLFLFAIFVLPQIGFVFFVLSSDKADLSDLIEMLYNLALPAVLIFLIIRKLKKKGVSEEKPLFPDEIEKRKKDYENMLNNHLITQEDYEKMIRQLDNLSLNSSKSDILR